MVTESSGVCSGGACANRTALDAIKKVKSLITSNTGKSADNGWTVEVTRLLAEWNRGDRSALQKLVPLVYDELHRIAGRALIHQAPQTLQCTDLVNEAYLRLASKDSVAFQDRTHFFAISARIVRSVLVDHARARGTAKRGAGAITMTVAEDVARSDPREVDLLALDEVLERLTALDAQQAGIVEMRFFAGLSVEETAAVMGISPATVKRDWAMARRWIFKELSAA
jgi:RNA polymerase sigma factor (TIGR02999 family)